VPSETEVNLGRKVSVLVADDHSLIVEAFRKLLEPKFDVVGVASDGRELLELALKTKPDVILLDLGMPNLNGFDAGRQVKKLLPTSKIVVVTMSEDGYTADAALCEWAAGFITKTSAASQLLNAIEAALTGKQYIVPQIALRLSQHFIDDPHSSRRQGLTFREREVLQLLAEGLSMKQAAAELHITPRTIAFHKYKIMKRYDLKSNSTFLRFAMEQQVPARPETTPSGPPNSMQPMPRDHSTRLRGR